MDETASESHRADSPEAIARPDDLVGAIARFVRGVHSGGVQTSATQVDDRTEHLLSIAQARVSAGHIDAERFDRPYFGQAPQRLLDIATGLFASQGAKWTERVPLANVHLSDLTLRDGEVSAAPSLSGSIVGDPYEDFARLARDLSTAIGPGAVAALFDLGGIERPDPSRIEFWVLLIQLT